MDVSTIAAAGFCALAIALLAWGLRAAAAAARRLDELLGYARRAEALAGGEVLYAAPAGGTLHRSAACGALRRADDLAELAVAAGALPVLTRAGAICKVCADAPLGGPRRLRG